MDVCCCSWSQGAQQQSVVRRIPTGRPHRVKEPKRLGCLLENVRRGSRKLLNQVFFWGIEPWKNGDFPRHRQLEKIQAFCPTPSRLKRVSRLVKAPSRITNNSLPCHSPIGTADWMARLDHPNSEDTVCQKPDTVDCWAKLHPASLGWTNSQKSGFQGCLARLCCPGSGQNDHQTSNVVGSLATSHHQGFGQNDYQRSSCEDHPWLCLRWPQ